MGKWSEYFEDFPDKNPANSDRNGNFDAVGAAQRGAANEKARGVTAALHATLKRMQEAHWGANQDANRPEGRMNSVSQAT